MAYPSTSCVSDPCAEYEDEAKALLEGLSDAETYVGCLEDEDNMLMSRLT